MIQLETFEGHIVLYCKNHYQVENVDFITGLQRIWAIRCGYDVEAIDNGSKEYIANAMYKIIKKTNPQKLDYLFELVHKEISKDYLSTYEGLTSIEKLIKIYRGELAFLQIKDSKSKGGYTTLIKLPKPQKRVFKRIINGKGGYNDYKLIK